MNSLHPNAGKACIGLLVVLTVFAVLLFGFTVLEIFGAVKLPKLAAGLLELGAIVYGGVIIPFWLRARAVRSNQPSSVVSLGHD